MKNLKLLPLFLLAALQGHSQTHLSQFETNTMTKPSLSSSKNVSSAQGDIRSEYVDRQLKSMNLSYKQLQNLSQKQSLGGGDAGGGKGIVCRNSNGSLKSVELLDFYEAESIYHKQIINESSLPVEKLVENAILLASQQNFGGNRNIQYSDGRRFVGADAVRAQMQDTADLFFRALKAHYSKSNITYSNFAFLRNTNIVQTPDSFELAVPAGCNVEQIINFQDGRSSGTAKILMNLDLFEKMTPIHQAGLIAHEVIYEDLRSNSLETNSIRTRNLVSSLFLRFPENETFYSVDQILKGKRYILCKSDAESVAVELERSSKIYIYEERASEKSRQYGEYMYGTLVEKIGGVSMINPIPSGSFSFGKLEDLLRTSKNSEEGFERSMGLSTSAIDGRHLGKISHLQTNKSFSIGIRVDQFQNGATPWIDLITCEKQIRTWK